MSTTSIEFLERAGDLALEIKTPQGDLIAERAYREASEKLKVQVTQPSAQLPDNPN